METQHDHHRPSDPIEVLIERIAGVVTGRKLTDQELDAVRAEAVATLNDLSASQRSQVASLLGLPKQPAKSKLTPPELARLWGISPDKVLSWIRSGELRAINIATDRTARPRYVIDEKDIAAFEQRRANGSQPAQRLMRKRRSAPGVIQFY